MGFGAAVAAIRQELRRQQSSRSWACFVLVRVISWITLFLRVERTIHEITRTNTNKTPREIEF
jgi:hypothetical protein